MEIITTNKSIQLECEVFGPESEPHILLVSGPGEPMEFWPESFCRELAAESYYVIRYCHRDTGLSQHFDAKYPMDELLDDMLGVIDNYGGKSVHIVGHSMGGYMAELAMCRWPWRFISATAISAGPTPNPYLKKKIGIGHTNDQTLRILMAHTTTGNLDADLHDWLEILRFLSGKRKIDENMAVAYTRAMYVGDKRNCRAAEHHIFSMSTLPTTLPEELRRSHCAFLAIHGTEDPLVPVDNATIMTSYISSAKLHLMQGAGHMFFDPATWRELRDVLLDHFRNTE